MRSTSDTSSNIHSILPQPTDKNGQRRNRLVTSALHDAVRAELHNGDVLWVGQSIAVLVRILAFRRAPADLDQAIDIVSRLEAHLAPDSEPALRLWPLQCRAVLADATGDELAHLDAVTRYRDLAERLDARGHIADARQLARR